MARELDAIDRRILDVLQADGRLSIVELAARINLTKTPCAERVRRLERAGIIGGYRAILDPQKVGREHVTVVQVVLSRTSDTSLQEFDDAVRDIPEIQTCLMVAGSFDYLLTVRTRDLAHYRAIYGEKIAKLPHMMHTHSFAVMDTVKDVTAIQMHES